MSNTSPTSQQAQQAVANKIQPVTARSRHVKGIIYGLPGVGKTSLCATAPKPIVIDVERGTKALLGDPRYEGVRIIEPEAFKEVDTLFWAIRNGVVECETLVLDSVSEFQRTHLDEILLTESSKNSSRNPYLAQQQDYRLSTEMMRRHLLAMRELPIHFLITAHAVETKDEVTGQLIIRPAVTPKLAGTLIGMMDLIGYLEIGDKKDRKLVTLPTRRIQAKNRLGLPAEITNPTFKDLLGNLESGSKQVQSDGLSLT